MVCLHTVALVVFCIISGLSSFVDGESRKPKLTGARFLVAVNTTDEPGCMAVVSTDMIKPDLLYNQSKVLQVGGCDHGPLNYTLVTPGTNGNKYTIRLTYYSTVIEDAEPPTCDIGWNGTYVLPSARGARDLLPSCYTEDSREGWHLTYYWFQLLDWHVE